GDLDELHDAPHLVVTQNPRQPPLRRQWMQRAAAVGPLSFVGDPRADGPVGTPDDVAVGCHFAGDDALTVTECRLDDDRLGRAGDRVRREGNPGALRSDLPLDDERHPRRSSAVIRKYPLTAGRTEAALDRRP